MWQFPVEGKLKEETWDDSAKRGLEEELEIQKFSRKQIDKMISSGEICDN